MTIYEKNLKILKNMYPEMDVLIKEAEKKKKDEHIEIIEEISNDEKRIIRIKKESRECYLGGRRNASEPVEIWMQTLGDLTENAPILMMGLGNSNYLKTLAEQIDKHLIIIIFEPSLQIFLDFLKHENLEKWMKKHTIVFLVEGLNGMDLSTFPQIINQVLRYEMLPYSRFFILPNYDTLFPEKAIEFAKICQRSAMEQVILRNTRKTFSDVMAKNIYSNVKYLCDAYKTTQLVKVIPRDIPGIVVAAGPSLNKNIQELKKAKGKALIFAVDTAVKPLLKAGVVPDMLMIVDAIKPLNLFQMEGVEKIPFVTTLNAASAVLDYHKGMKLFFNEGYQIGETIFSMSEEPFGIVSSGGSVATSAFSLLHKIGLTTIILVGQDLAYTNNRTHADGTFQEKMDEVNTQGMIMVDGNYEDKVPTAADLKQFLDWYNDIIGKIQELNPKFRVINATEGGAKIKNTEIMPLKKAIEQECTKDVDINECLNRLSPMLTDDKRKLAVEYLKNIPTECQEAKHEAIKLKKIYQKLNKVCQKKNIDTKEYLSVLKKIKKQIPILEKYEPYKMAEITLSDAKYIINSEQYIHEESVSEEGKEIARKGLLYIDMVIQCCDLFYGYTKLQYENWN